MSSEARGLLRLAGFVVWILAGLPLFVRIVQAPELLQHARYLCWLTCYFVFGATFGLTRWTVASPRERRLQLALVAIQAAWHPPVEVPSGTPHGANGLCVTAEGRVVLISNDAERWGWPGGRPERDESWEQTLRREILEEACCVVREARLLGFCRSACLSGPEKGLVLVRSIWRAEVDLMPWDPNFEITHRRVVCTDELLSNLWMEEGFEPIYHRALREAGLWRKK